MVLSGGMDSVTMLHEYASEIEFAVNFSYGSNHNARELECARYHCAQLGIELVEIDLEFIARYFHSSLLEGPDAVPEGDYDLYPDCRKGFIDAMSKAIQEGTYDGITVKAPYTLLSKADIALRGKRLGIDYSTTYSCYRGGEKHCGRCGTCLERRQALRDAGITDTTEYEEN